MCIALLIFGRSAFAGENVTCGAVKMAYSRGGCCGQPGKDFHISTIMGSMCAGSTAESADATAPTAIFDPPTADEMGTVATRMASYDFSGEGGGIVLNPAPFEGPDRGLIESLFGNHSLATTQMESVGPIWVAS